MTMRLPSPAGPDRESILRQMRQSFGTTRGAMSDLDWSESAGRLGRWTFDPSRGWTVLDYELLREFLDREWHLPCIEVETANLGLFSTRLLRFTRKGSYYLVVKQSPRPAEKLVALLHELGHFVLHGELLLRISKLFLRICMDPSLEFLIGRSLHTPAGQSAMRSIEAQADLFAATWAVPPAITTEARQRGPDEVALVDYVLLKDLFAAAPLGLERDMTEPVRKELLVAALDARARVLDRHYPEDASAWKRLIWALSHRGSLLQELESGTVTQFISSLDPGAQGARHFPELSYSRPMLDSAPDKPDGSFAWVRREPLHAVYEATNREQWEPFIVTRDEMLPNYYIPIAPVVGSRTADSEALWQNLTKPDSQIPCSLSTWISKSFSSRGGLMIFSRTPAERWLADNEKESSL